MDGRPATRGFMLLHQCIQKSNITKEDSEIKPGYSRVTQVIGYWNDFSSIPQDVLSKAADRGTRVHKYCEEYCRLFQIFGTAFFDKEGVDADCKPYVISFINWFDKMVVRVTLQEERLYDDEYMVCGKPDFVGELVGDNGYTSLIEIKTPQQHKKSWAVQTAGYCRLLHVNGMQVPRRRLALILDKDGGPARIVEYLNHQQDGRIFIMCCNTHNYFNY